MLLLMQRRRGRSLRLPEDSRHPETVILDFRGCCENLGPVQALAHLVVAKHVDERERVGGWVHAGRIQGFNVASVVEHCGQLKGEPSEFFGAETEPCEARYVRHVIGCYRPGHPHMLGERIGPADTRIRDRFSPEVGDVFALRLADTPIPGDTRRDPIPVPERRVAGADTPHT